MLTTKAPQISAALLLFIGMVVCKDEYKRKPHIRKIMHRWSAAKLSKEIEIPGNYTCRLNALTASSQQV